MDKLVEIAPECPICKGCHRQSFWWEDLRELLRRGSISLYCPRLDESWLATRELRERLARIADTFERLHRHVGRPLDHSHSG